MRKSKNSAINVDAFGTVQLVVKRRIRDVQKEIPQSTGRGCGRHPRRSGQKGGEGRGRGITGHMRLGNAQVQ